MNEDNNSIIIKINDLKNKKTFNFSDNINDSYYFGFELEIITYVDQLLIIFIIICAVLLILLVILLILLFKKNKKINEINEKLVSPTINSNSILEK